MDKVNNNLPSNTKTVDFYMVCWNSIKESNGKDLATISRWCKWCKVEQMEQTWTTNLNSPELLLGR